MKTALLRLFALGTCWVLMNGCTRIKPDETGVRTINFGQDKGIVSADYTNGYHRFLWPLDSWHRFPSTIQQIRFAKEIVGASPQPEGPLQVISADGDKVVMYGEILFRIAVGEAHRVLQDSGSGERYKEVVRSLGQDAARVLFGRLRTEAFYDVASREMVRQEAVRLLQSRLQPRGIELIDLLMDSIEFEPNYEELIKKKKIADQRVELEKAKSRAAEELGRVAKIAIESKVKVQKIEHETEAEMTQRTAETDVLVGSLKAEAEKYAVERRADAALHQAQREAGGQRLVKLAEAEGTQRLNEALVGEGGQNLVALEAVKKLNLSDVTFPSVGFEWFNPFDMAARIGAAGRARTDSGTASNR